MDPYLIEVSSEAGRKIGGIYTVIRSKSRFIKNAFKDKYLFIGFYDETCSHDVRFEKPPIEYESVFAELSALGIFCHYGKWIYANNTPIILVDSKSFAQRSITYEDGGQMHHDTQVNYIKFMLWKAFSIDSLMEKSWDFSENAAWGWAVGMLLEKLSTIKPFENNPVAAHFHEWICGSAVLYSRLKNLPIATVFTTHATVLGRSLSSSGQNILELANDSKTQIDISKAYDAHVEGKHQLEMAAAKKCHIFTTVSHSVAQEVKYILGKTPDVITLNGMDFDYEKEESKARNLSTYTRQEVLQLCESIFAPYDKNAKYSDALLVYTSGRYEYHNKGYDLFIKSLADLNKKLKKHKSTKQIFAFIFAPSAISGPKISVIKNYLLMDKINEILDESLGVSTKEHYDSTYTRINTTNGNLQNDLKNMFDSLIKDPNGAPNCLYNLNYAHDNVLNELKRVGLENKPEDKVKVIFYPSYLRPSDGLLNMGYYDIISGMDVGVFASRYEPFGYTPLESSLNNNISVSTDCAGFGKFLLTKHKLDNRGVKVLKLVKDENVAQTELSDYLELLYTLDNTELKEMKKDSYDLMKSFDWKDLTANYLEAYNLAFEKIYDDNEIHIKQPISDAEHVLTSTNNSVVQLIKNKKQVPMVIKKKHTELMKIKEKTKALVKPKKKKTALTKPKKKKTAIIKPKKKITKLKKKKAIPKKSKKKPVKQIKKTKSTKKKK